MRQRFVTEIHVLLHKAAEEGMVDVVRILLAAGADKEARKSPLNGKRMAVRPLPSPLFPLPSTLPPPPGSSI